VFGLRRAFQIAGRAPSSSLWSVEDLATRTWMRDLYNARFNEHLTPQPPSQSESQRGSPRDAPVGQSAHPFFFLLGQFRGGRRLALAGLWTG